MNFAEQNLTGKASIDKPWLNFYPEEFRNLDIPRITMESFLKMKNPDENRAAFEYYGNKITWKQFWAEVDIAARALKALGFEVGDRIPSFLPSTPAYYILLFAAERVGVTVICRDDEPEELCFAIRKSRTDTAFAMDYVSKEDEELFRTTTPMTRMIKVSPFEYADKSQMKDYVLKEIESRYPAETETVEGDMSWQEFMELGRNFEGEYLAPTDPERAVFGAYTSDSFFCKCGSNCIPDVHLYSAVRGSGGLVDTDSSSGTDCGNGFHDNLPAFHRTAGRTGSVLPVGGY